MSDDYASKSYRLNVGTRQAGLLSRDMVARAAPESLLFHRFPAEHAVADSLYGMREGGLSSGESYTLSRDDREYRRLSVQSLVWEAATRRALEQVSLQRGAHALDVGCGTGDVMRLIAEFVGNTGRVTGLDSDARLLDAVRTRLQAERPGTYRFVWGNATDAACEPVGQFDMVFARLLLFHLQDPLATLRRLWDWVQPSGVLLIMEYDLTGMRSVPQHPTIERVLRLINAAFRRSDRDIEIGSRMPALFVDAGLGTPGACEVNGVVIPGAPSVSMLREVVVSLLPVLLGHRITDAAALSRIDRELMQPDLNEYFLRWPDMITTWKRKAR